MFAIFWMLANGIARGIGAVKDGVENSQAWNKGYNKKVKGQNNYNIYYDNRGCARDLDSGRRVYIGPYGKHGEVIVEDERGNVLRNITQEKRDIKYEEKKRNTNGDTVCRYMSEHDVSSRKMSVPGERYKDLNNGRLYVERTIKTDRVRINPNCAGYKRLNGCTEMKFYIDVDTLMVVRETDSSYQFRKKCLAEGDKWALTDEEINSLISDINESRKSNYEKVKKENECWMIKEHMVYTNKCVSWEGK